MPGIYRILTSNGWGYLGQTNAKQPAIYRVADHIINSYSLPNYHYGGKREKGDNSAMLTKYVCTHGGQSLSYYLDEDPSTAFGFGAENWEHFRKYWYNDGDAVQRKLDIMELTGIYLGEKRGTRYNTDKGGKRNFLYDTTILCKTLDKHFIQYKIKPSTRESLIKAVSNITFDSQSQSKGLYAMFNPEYTVLNEAWNGKIINNILFPKNKILDLLNIHTNKEINYKMSSKRGFKIGDYINQQALKKDILNTIHNLGKAFNSINQLKIQGEEDWLRFNYFTIDCTVNSEQFWKEFWEQVNAFVKLTKEGVLQIKKNIKISDLAFKLQIIQNRIITPQWVSSAVLPQQDVKDKVRDVFVINFAEIIEVARRDWQGNPQRNLKDYVFQNLNQESIIGKDFELFYTKMMKATREAQFGPLLFEQVLNAKGQPYFFRGNPVYRMRRTNTDTLGYVTFEEMRDILHYNTDGVFW